MSVLRAERALTSCRDVGEGFTKSMVCYAVAKSWGRDLFARCRLVGLYSLKSGYWLDDFFLSP